jgi:hypothetical protein
MARPPTTAVPAFYRLYFLWCDPIICVWAIYMNFFTPGFVINAFVPSSIAPHNPQFDFLLQQLAGSLLLIGFLATSLLRYTQDIAIWKIFETGILLYDLVMLYSVYDALSRQGRLGLGAMRATEDWGGLAITGLAVIVRSAFLLNVGIARPSAKKLR